MVADLNLDLGRIEVMKHGDVDSTSPCPHPYRCSHHNHTTTNELKSVVLKQTFVYEKKIYRRRASYSKMSNILDINKLMKEPMKLMVF